MRDSVKYGLTAAVTAAIVGGALFIKGLVSDRREQDAESKDRNAGQISVEVEKDEGADSPIKTAPYRGTGLQEQPSEKETIKADSLEDFVKKFSGERFLETVPEQLEEILRVYPSWRKKEFVEYLRWESPEGGFKIGYRFGNISVSEEQSEGTKSDISRGHNLIIENLADKKKNRISRFDYFLPGSSEAESFSGLIARHNYWNQDKENRYEASALLRLRDSNLHKINRLRLDHNTGEMTIVGGIPKPFDNRFPDYVLHAQLLEELWKKMGKGFQAFATSIRQ